LSFLADADQRTEILGVDFTPFRFVVLADRMAHLRLGQSLGRLFLLLGKAFPGRQLPLERLVQLIAERREAP